ncbi:hypothetical protein [Paenibacillus donghaensis]|uniref:Uncharacterized protein n=1 Tax=Paenibacillus donghaensis TaxID=414771 RepID=A0A2Z2KYY7_9BACL|nr:hypothetical protein [Paenibacillus donghaensis]ASA25958.1 hypothetical protein B9T62_37755 [Paenibacillus donghaensis]
MTIKSWLTLRNFMIILCILMIVMLGERSLRIAGKIKAVDEADRLYAAGDLISAEEQYRLAAANTSILYMEEKISARLDELSPLSAIRRDLDTLVNQAKIQAQSGDFDGMMLSYESLISLKAKVLKPGDSNHVYELELLAASGISDQLTAYLGQFREQFLAELAQTPADATAEESAAEAKWKLLRIPGDLYGGEAVKQKQLAASFKAHDTAKLKLLAAAGSVAPLLEQAKALTSAYSSHSYDAPWVMDQTEGSYQLLLDKDLKRDTLTAFIEHAAAYRSFILSTGLHSAKVSPFIEKQRVKLMARGERLVRTGDYVRAIQLYAELDLLQDTSAESEAANLAWNVAEPVRLLPGGEEPGRYGYSISAAGSSGTRVMAAGVDSSGVLYYAAQGDNGSVLTLPGEPVPAYEGLRGLVWDGRLGAASGVPVVVAESGSGSGRTVFSAYEMRPEGMTRLFSFAGDAYELLDDESIQVTNADPGFVEGLDGAAAGSGQTALYRKVSGVYQFAEILQQYTSINAVELESRPFQNISLNCEIAEDSNGRTIGYCDGRYLSLQGQTEGATGNSVISGQYQYGSDYIITEAGEQYVPIFVVDSIESLGSGTVNETELDAEADAGVDNAAGAEIDTDAGGQ